MRDILIPIQINPEPAGMPAMRFARVGDTIDIFVNGQKIVVLDIDEWNMITKVMAKKR